MATEASTFGSAIAPSEESSPSSPTVSYFRPRNKGPESRIEDAVISSFGDLFRRDHWPLWMGGSVPIGSGFPDLVSAWYDPRVLTITRADSPDGHILSYLRSVRHARFETIAQRLRYSYPLLESRMDVLENLNAVSRTPGDTFKLSKQWRDILPEVIAVEAKVTNWRSAFQQAIRNRVFAHRSFIALPDTVAQRVLDTPGFALHGIGVLSVGDWGSVSIRRSSRLSKPVVWGYYYRLAVVAAHDLNTRNGL